MSSPRPVSRSMHSVTNAAVANKLRPRSLSPPYLSTPFLSPDLQGLGNSSFFEPSTSFLSTPHDQLRTKFVNALVQAGSCRHGAKRRASKRFDTIRHESTVSLLPPRKVEPKRLGMLDMERQLMRLRVEQYTRLEYLSLVHMYRMDDNDENKAVPETKPTEGEQKDPDNILSLGWSEGLGPHGRQFRVAEGKAARAVAKLQHLVTDDSSTPENVYKAYQKLPKPGLKYLDRGDRIYLLRKLSVHQHRSSIRTMRFYSVLDDYKAAGLRIPRHAWNSAINLGARTLLRVSDAEVEVALKTWKEMEHTTGIKSNTATFNILFDTAAKAGKFALASMILQEMQARGFQMDRFTWFGHIFAQGLKGDGHAVRKAYRDYVNAGELVDTAVLNCVMAALLNCEEPEAAEMIFQRMRTLAVEKEGKHYAPKSWEKGRELSRILKWLLRSDSPEAARENMRSIVSIAPDVRTCNILLAEFCKKGELHRAVSMLDEMSRLDLRPDNRTFRDLMRGFAKHGGVRYSTWTRERLEIVWRSYRPLLDEKHPDLYLTKWMVLYTLQAFHKCRGAERELEIWEELKSRWKQDTHFAEFAPRPQGQRSSWDVFKSR